jgi:molybdate transport system permease protein
MANLDLTPLWITLKLAFVTTALLLIISIPIAWWLSRTKSRFRVLIESIVSLPLVLPPTVLGFYLLIALGPQVWGEAHFAFSFMGLVIGSMCYSLPFVVQPIKNSFESIDGTILEAASTLGASSFDRFSSIVLPMARPGILTAAILGFAHTIGEFGVVLMIGGNIPGKTQVISIAIYDHVESLEYSQAHLMSGGLLLLSFFLLLFIYTINRRFSGVRL